MRKMNDLGSKGQDGRGIFRRLARDQRGSVAIWVGLTLTVFIGCAGMAVDTARGYMVKSRLSQALDAAALAGAKSLGSLTSDEDITMFFNANFPAGELDAIVDGPHITSDPNTNTVKVTAAATIDSTLMSVLGFETITVAAEATATRGISGLDVVIAIDMSGSMCSPCTKIEAAETAAKTLIDTLYADPGPKTVDIGGINYSLLNIGMVPWNAKVNVRYNAAISTAVFDRTLTVEHPIVPPFVNPVTGATQSVLYTTNISEVMLLSNPPAGWNGGVYARYIDDYRASPLVPSDNTNDADLKLGYGTFGGKEWIAYEPIPPLEGEPVSGSWPSSGEGTNWNSQSKNCYEAYWNDGLADPNHPTSISDAPSYWVRANSNQGNANSNECTDTLVHGVLPLQGVTDLASKQVVTNTIDGLYAPPGSKPRGNTNAPQGLYWAWEVLMPGSPYNQARASVPFNRTQAIVLLTDGANTGNNGDAYKGVFGPDAGAGTTNKHGKLSDGASDNNLNNRLKELAANIKGADPDKGVKIYVVQYDEPSATLQALLQSVATEPGAPYYYQANDAAALQTAFQKIAASLSVLRLSK